MEEPKEKYNNQICSWEIVDERHLAQTVIFIGQYVKGLIDTTKDERYDKLRAKKVLRTLKSKYNGSTNLSYGPNFSYDKLYQIVLVVVEKIRLFLWKSNICETFKADVEEVLDSLMITKDIHSTRTKKKKEGMVGFELDLEGDYQGVLYIMESDPSKVCRFFQA